MFYQGREIDSAHGVCVLGNRVIVSAGDSVFSFYDDNGDLKADVVTGTMQGNTRPVVKAFSGANYSQIDSFFAYSGLVGVSVAAR